MAGRGQADDDAGQFVAVDPALQGSPHIGVQLRGRERGLDEQRAGAGKQGVVKVVGATMVGPRERVVVVEVDNTWLLLGVGAGQVRLLDKRAKPNTPLREETE